MLLVTFTIMCHRIFYAVGILVRENTNLERIFLHVPKQAHSQVGARECNTPIRNRQNFKDKHADQSARKGVVPFCLHIMALLNNCNWKQLISKNVCICEMVSAMLQSALDN